MTAQEIFDKVVTHMLTQNKRAYDGWYCRLRVNIDDTILKCAVGCLIPDEKYKSSFENESLDTVLDSFPELQGHKYLLGALQTVHDFVGVSSWPRALEEVAQNFNLEFKNEHENNSQEHQNLVGSS